MVLVDTSVWVRHFQEGDPNLVRLLEAGEVLCHPFIVGELACGNLKNRREILSLLELLPLAVQARHREILKFIEQNRLMGKGLGYIDLHLLASAVLTGIPLWTLDKKLHEANEGLDTGRRF
jgi:hypothetical protein